MKVSPITFKSKSILHPKDLVYKKALQQGLFDDFRIKCKIEDLSSVAGPVELNKIINTLKPENYKPGESFRANFHMHTNASDGRMSAKDVLDQCVDWVKQLSKNLNIKDNLPLFSAAITDHDRVLNSKKAIAMISQEPEKYKDFRFVAGCEFMLNNPENHTAFEAVGLGFNPFDKKLERLMKGFSSNNKISDIPDIKSSGGVLSLAHPLITPHNVCESFFEFLKRIGVDGVEANYQYIRFDQEYIQEAIRVTGIEELVKKFKMFRTGGTDSHGKSIFSP